MLIRSKFKDYYDYLQGVYGIDKKVVYERADKNGMYKPEHVEFPELYADKLNCYAFAICGIIFIVHVYRGKFYFGEDVKLILKENKGKYGWKYWTHKGGESVDLNILEYHLKKTNINDKEDCPVCHIIPRYSRERFEAGSKMVRLSDFGFPQVISAHDMYIQISNWLSREKKIVDKRTDLEKIVGHGFDKKTSFRKM